MDVELETWVEPTIQEEIARGKLLQKQKAISAARNNLVYVKSPRLAKGGILHRRKSPVRKWRRPPNSPVVKQTSASTSRDESYILNRNPRMGRPVCSMRISELAAPTKRQCIASWRANANILPENMVNRLKKRVMDQEPIVKVSDAVNCIKQVKPPSNTCASVIWQNKRSSKRLTKAEMNKKIHAENQVLGEVFGRKMTQHLMKPMSITLNSRLKKVSHIISEEIYTILKDTKTLRINKASNERIVQEVSEKVTIWMAKILDDSAEKLLEEDLKELEEQEGPVLDILDHIVDSVLHKCIRTPSDNLTPDFVSVSSGDKDNRHDYDDVAQGDKQDEVSDTGTIRTGEEATQGDEGSKNAEMLESGAVRADEIAAKGDEDFEVSDTIENDVARQINKLIDSLKHEDFDDDIRPEEPEVDVLYSKDNTQLKLSEHEFEDIKNKDENTDVSDTQDLNKLDGIEDIQQGIDNSATLLPVVGEYPELAVKHDQENANDTLEDNISKTSEINDNTENQTDANDSNEKDNFNETETSNVSDAFEVISAELSEEKNRKVKFSNENLDPMIENEKDKPINSETLQSEDEQLLQDVGFEKSITNIDFASPNEKLLSNADETWPDDVSATRPAAGVSRSVASMGNIVETDERYSISLDATDHPSPRKDEIDENKDKIDDKEPKQNTETEIIDENINETDYSSQNAGKTHETGDDEKNRDEDLHHTTEIMPHEQLEQFNELGGALGLDTTHDIIVTQKDDIDILYPQFIVHEITTVAGQKESVVIINNEELQDSRNIQASEPLEKRGSVAKTRDRSKRTEHSKEDSSRGHQRRASADGGTSKKFDYRVHQKTAPSWIKRGQGEPTEHLCACRPFHHPAPFQHPVPFQHPGPFHHPANIHSVSGTNRMEDREQEIRKWCQELDFILKNLDNWKNWLNYVSKYITGLKQKADDKDDVWERRHRSRRTVDRLIRSFSPINNERWRKLNKDGLKQRRHDDADKYKISPPPVKYCVKCGRKKPSHTRKRHHRHHSRNHGEMRHHSHY